MQGSGDVMVVDMQIFTVIAVKTLQCLHAMGIVHMYDILLYRFTNQQDVINYAQLKAFESVTVVIMKNTL